LLRELLDIHASPDICIFLKAYLGWRKKSYANPTKIKTLRNKYGLLYNCTASGVQECWGGNIFIHGNIQLFTLNSFVRLNCMFKCTFYYYRPRGSSFETIRSHCSGEERKT